MTLQQLATGATPYRCCRSAPTSILHVKSRRAWELGLLDPPADGRFGPVSSWALAQFLRRVDLRSKTVLDREVARALIESSADDVYPLNLPDTLAGRIARAMRGEGHWLSRHPDCINIVYVEGLDADGEANENTPNHFNDQRLLLRINRAGNPDIPERWEATTEPGMFFTVGPDRHKDGAARIAFGQYKSWSVGKHRAGAPSEHEALVQVAPIDIFRDLNADFQRVGNRPVTGMFHINQHWGFDFSKTDIRNASAGCLVGRTKAGHRTFMSLCRSDPRFLVNNAYRFMTAVLPAAKI